MAEPVVARKKLYAGARWRLCFGRYAGPERFAVEEMQKIVQRHLPYLLRTEPAGAHSKDAEDHLILVGTVDGNPLLAELAGRGVLRVPAEAESYTIARLPSPWRKGTIIAAAGRDTKGTANAVADLGARTFGVEAVRDGVWGTPGTLDRIVPFTHTEIPRITDRGIWSWGYPIRDYRRFIDNMARLRMNLLTLWNDCPPINAAEVVAHAHDRGIRVVMGFPWGWGLEGLDLGKPEHIEWLKRTVIEGYEKDYADVPHDGIYFQTDTEVQQTERGGVPIARLACDMVNEVGGALLERHPGLWIQFGLHATSIRNHRAELERLDPRITVTWEDAGVIPWTYDAVTRLPHRADGSTDPLGSVDATIAYARELASLRGCAEMAMVPKGFACLRWDSEFEHHGPFLLGERGAVASRSRLEERRAGWDAANGLWMANYPYAARFFREILAVAPRRVIATALVEDGAFEERIQPAVALLSHILWNPSADEAELPRLASSAYYGEPA